MAKKQKEVKESEGTAPAEAAPLSNQAPQSEVVSETEQAPQTEAVSEAEQAPETKTAIEAEPDNSVKALIVVAARGGFRRAGIQFGKEPVTLNLHDLTPEQVDQIINEPMLTVTPIEGVAE
ncbi:HI1506-related protein [Nitrosovibrio sp. Nv4]|uniref:HI1506-related protein n=1 Tax=Nitrosovibrio sp. Nv4 TaxID=1945880 RepID=UPI000BD1B3B0|nr:HI1506-related protein [Nitrosovibrio sp. Nv4]SOD42325.1 hypothetical protein SAMN06298226_2664 [Nitrosovibrio sp. Nv4]